MRSLLVAFVLFTSACVDEREPFLGYYRTTASMTIVEGTAQLPFASSESTVNVTENGDDALWVQAFASRGASVECSFSMVVDEDSFVLDPNSIGSECTICNELRDDCWRVDLVSATGQLAGRQLTLDTSGAAVHTTGAGQGTANGTFTGPRD